MRPTEKQIEAAMELSTGFGLFRQYGNMKVATGLSNDEVRALSAALAVEAGTEPRAWFVKDYADGWIYFDNEVDAQAYRAMSGSALLVAYSPDALTTSPASSAVEGEAGLIGFAKAMIRLSWEGCDADGGLIQETALKFGLLEQTVFDGKKHKDPQGFTEDGDWWYVFAGPLASPAPQTEDRE